MKYWQPKINRQRSKEQFKISFERFKVYFKLKLLVFLIYELACRLPLSDRLFHSKLYRRTGFLGTEYLFTYFIHTLLHRNSIKICWKTH